MSGTTPLNQKEKGKEPLNLGSSDFNLYQLKIGKVLNAYQCNQCTFILFNAQETSTKSMIYHFSHDHQIYKHNKIDNR